MVYVSLEPRFEVEKAASGGVSRKNVRMYRTMIFRDAAEELVRMTRWEILWRTTTGTTRLPRRPVANAGSRGEALAPRRCRDGRLRR